MTTETRKKGVLVIDDDPGMQRFLKEALESEGYEVTTASNGMQGLFRAQQDEPDLAILDVMLPGLDGFEVCHRLRADPRTSHLPVMMLTGKERVIDRETGEKVGANKFLSKPVELDVLLSTVESLVQSKSRSE